MPDVTENDFDLSRAEKDDAATSKPVTSGHSAADSQAECNAEDESPQLTPSLSGINPTPQRPSLASAREGRIHASTVGVVRPNWPMLLLVFGVVLVFLLLLGFAFAIPL